MSAISVIPMFIDAPDSDPHQKRIRVEETMNPNINIVHMQFRLNEGVYEILNSTALKFQLSWAAREQAMEFLNKEWSNIVHRPLFMSSRDPDVTMSSYAYNDMEQAWKLWVSVNVPAGETKDITYDAAEIMYKRLRRYLHNMNMQVTF